MARLVNRFLRDRSGATAIEYAILAALIAVIIIASVTTLGTTINGFFANVATNVGAAK